MGFSLTFPPLTLPFAAKSRADSPPVTPVSVRFLPPTLRALTENPGLPLNLCETPPLLFRDSPRNPDPPAIRAWVEARPPIGRVNLSRSPHTTNALSIPPFAPFFQSNPPFSECEFFLSPPRISSYGLHPGIVVLSCSFVRPPLDGS